MNLLLALLLCVQDPVPTEKPKQAEPSKTAEAPAKKPDGDKKAEKEVIITADRRESDVMNVPAGVTVVTGEQIKESGASNMIEVMQRQTSFFSQGQVKGAQDQMLDMRGFNNGTGTGQRTLVLVDGRKTNAVVSSSTDWTTIPMDHIDRIEIVRGPAAAIYGDTALAGVINIITKKAGKDPSASLTFSGGAWNTFNLSASAAGSMGPYKADAFLILDRTDGYRDHSNYHGETFGGRVEYSEDPSLHAFVKAGHHEDFRFRPGSLTLAEIALVGRRGTTSRAGEGHVAEHYVDLGLDSEVEDLGTLSFFTNFTHENDNSIDNTFGFPFAINGHSEIFTAQAKHVMTPKIFAMDSGFTTGIDFSFEQAGAGSTFGSSFYTRRMIGFYEQLEIHVIPTLVAHAGVRYDRGWFTLDNSDPMHVDRAVDQWSPQGGLTWRVVEPVSVFASVGRTFKNPNRDELMGFFAGAPQLNPEIATTYQGGVRISEGGFSGEVLYYWMVVHNEIFWDPVLFSNMNFERVTHSGVETQARYAVTEWLEAFGTYTYTKVTINRATDPTLEGNTYPVTPAHAATLGITVKQEGVQLTLDARYAGRRLLISDYQNSFPALPDYIVYDARVSYTWKQLTVFANVYNFTNRLYFDSGGTNGRFNPAPERSWMLGFDLKL